VRVGCSKMPLYGVGACVLVVVVVVVVVVEFLCVFEGGSGGVVAMQSVLHTAGLHAGVLLLSTQCHCGDTGLITQDG